MRNQEFLQELSEKLSRLVPFAGELQDDFRSKIEAVLRQALEGLELLTLEEFEARSRALHRAERRVEELDALVRELERRLAELESGS